MSYSEKPIRISIGRHSEQEWLIRIHALSVERDVRSREYTVPSWKMDSDLEPGYQSLAYFSGGDDKQYQKLKSDLAEVGRQLFQRLYQNAAQEWETIIQEGSGPYLLELESDVRDLPWELLYHEKMEFLDTFTRPIVRKMDEARVCTKRSVSRLPSVCFVGADDFSHPTRSTDQRETIINHFPTLLNGSHSWHNVVPKPEQNKTQWEVLCDTLQAFQPDILHIVAHGDLSAGFWLEGVSNHDRRRLIRYVDLLRFLENCACVRLLVLSVCQSGSFFNTHPEIIQRVFAYSPLESVVAMSTDMSGEALLKFTDHFYKELYRGRGVSKALGVARHFLRSSNDQLFSLQWSVPMLYEREPINPFEGIFESSPVGGRIIPFPVEYIEEAGDALLQIESGILELSDLQRQLRPPAAYVLFAASKIGTAARNFMETLAMFDQNYQPQYEQLLNSIRAENSYFMPRVQKLVSEAKHSSQRRPTASMTRDVLQRCRQLTSQIDHLKQL